MTTTAAKARRHTALHSLIDLPQRSHDAAAGSASSKAGGPLTGGGNQEEGVPGPEASQARSRPR